MTDKTYKVVEYRTVKGTSTKLEPDFEKREYIVIKEKLTWAEAKKVREINKKYYVIVPEH